MRGFDCVAPDATHDTPAHFEGDSDEALVEQAKAHIDEYHSALGLTDDQVREMVGQGAYDIP